MYFVCCSYAIPLRLRRFMLLVNPYSFCTEQWCDCQCASEVTGRKWVKLTYAKPQTKHKLCASELFQTLAQQSPILILISIKLIAPTKRTAPTMYFYWTVNYNHKRHNFLFMYNYFSGIFTIIQWVHVKSCNKHF